MQLRCSKCKTFKDNNNFHKNKNAPNGYFHYCKECASKFRKEQYKKNHTAVRKRANENRHILSIEIRRKAFEYLLNHPCIDCGENDPIVLEFDHKNPKDKKYVIGNMINKGWNWKAIKKEIDKCRILCANCHRRRTSKQQNWYKYVITT